jgi:hypothetical protein
VSNDFATLIINEFSYEQSTRTAASAVSSDENVFRPVSLTIQCEGQNL